MPAPIPLKTGPNGILPDKGGSYGTLMRRVVLDSSLARHFCKKASKVVVGKRRLHIGDTPGAERLDFRRRFPFDYFCPSVAGKLDRRICGRCETYFASAALLRQHRSFRAEDGTRACRHPVKGPIADDSAVYEHYSSDEEEEEEEEEQPPVNDALPIIKTAAEVARFINGDVDIDKDDGPEFQ